MKLIRIVMIAFVLFGCRYMAPGPAIGVSPTPTPVSQPEEPAQDPLTYPSVSRATLERAVNRTYEAILWRAADEGGLKAYADTVERDGIKGWRSSLRSMSESEEFKS